MDESRRFSRLEKILILTICFLVFGAISVGFVTMKWSNKSKNRFEHKNETHETPESSTKMIKITNTADSPRKFTKGTLTDINGKLKFLEYLFNSNISASHMC